MIDIDAKYFLCTMVYLLFLITGFSQNWRSPFSWNVIDIYFFPNDVKTVNVLTWRPGKNHSFSFCRWKGETYFRQPCFDKMSSFSHIAAGSGSKCRQGTEMAQMELIKPDKVVAGRSYCSNCWHVDNASGEWT